MSDKTFDLYHDAGYTLALCAVRYALGRRTSVVGTIVDTVMEMAEDFTRSERALIARDIRECTDKGDSCDIKQWGRLLERLDKLGDTGTQESGPTLKPGSWYIFIPTDPISNKNYVGKRCKVLRHTSYNTTYDCFAYAVEFEDKTTWGALEVELSKVVEEESDKP